MWLRVLSFVFALWISVDTSGAAGTVVVSEFMAANSSTLLDEDGASSDWIELFNSGTTTVSLDGWFLTDEIGNLRKWRLPASNLPAGGYLVVFASGKDRRAPGAPLHTNFKLDPAGGFLPLVSPDGAAISSRYVYPGQHTAVSYGIGPENA